jgi:hypothetical protein
MFFTHPTAAYSMTRLFSTSISCRLWPVIAKKYWLINRQKRVNELALCLTYMGKREKNRMNEFAVSDRDAKAQQSCNSMHHLICAKAFSYSAITVHSKKEKYIKTLNDAITIPAHFC